jgi:hypothetical protein
VASSPSVTPALVPGAAPGLNASGTEKTASVLASFDRAEGRHARHAARGAVRLPALRSTMLEARV